MNEPSATRVPTALPFSPLEFVARIENAGRAQGFHIEHYGEQDGCPLLAMTKRTSGMRPKVYLSSGIHGDEPAPPLALLQMLEERAFDSRASWVICPLLNPSGFMKGTRENAQGLDLNRDYKEARSPEIRAHIAWLQKQPPFEVAICLHEDWESTGFYLYELNPDNLPSLAENIISAAALVAAIDRSPIIDGRESAAPGIIRPVSDPLLRESWPEAIYLRAHHSGLTYTLESPSSLPLPQRIAALRAAIESIWPLDPHPTF